MSIRMYDIIEKKKKGEELTRDEIFTMINEYTKGNIPDYQVSAWLMAVCFCGMSDRETFELTEAMALSGDTVDLSAFGDASVDKHSTGGVGDKTTLIVAPLVAASGGIVAKMSGRGLGHTGGTVDKLESFPSFRTTLSAEEFASQVKKCNIAVIGQSADIAPADKKLYALRDVTATVNSIPLIASSIMSKKLAAGTRSIVLDVKYGSGAFMHTKEDAKKLADLMVKIGSFHQRRTAAIISNMDIPLGYAIGNSLEVIEAIEVLRGGGPEDLREVCLTLAALMIERSCSLSHNSARGVAEDALSSGRAYEKFCEWIGEQGGNVAYAKSPELFGEAKYHLDVIADKDGYISSCNTEKIGLAAMILGAGRQTAESLIDHRAGIILSKKTYDKVAKGEVIARLYSEKEETLSIAKECLLSALVFDDKNPDKEPLIYKIIS